MFEIQDLSGLAKIDSWEVRQNNKVTFRGSFKDVLRYTVHELGFDLRDFERSIQAIAYNGHNTLHFTNKRLNSTSYQPVPKMRKAG